MDILAEKMLSDFERGALSRRQLVATIAGLAAAVGVSPAEAATAGPASRPSLSTMSRCGFPTCSGPRNSISSSSA